MAIPDHNDQQFCWQQVLRVQPSFRLTHIYAPQNLSAGLLALYALFSALEEALCHVSDEQVARVKLAWWQNQLLSSEYQTSEHPITRQLHRSGVINPETQEQFGGLLVTAMERLDGTAPRDEADLETMCTSIGLHPMRLEMAIQGGNVDITMAMKRACAVNGLIQLMRESSRNLMQPYAWIPLNLLARYSVSRSELHIGGKAGKTRALMEDVCGRGLSWVGNGDLCSQLAFGTKWKLQHRHWIIHTQLNVERLKNMPRLGFDAHRREFLTSRAGSAWLAWRTARRIYRGDSRK